MGILVFFAGLALISWGALVILGAALVPIIGGAAILYTLGLIRSFARGLRDRTGLR